MGDSRMGLHNESNSSVVLRQPVMGFNYKKRPTNDIHIEKRKPQVLHNSKFV
jgi:hypothetical protein